MDKILKALEIFRDVDPDGTTISMLFFCAISPTGEMAIPDLIKITKLQRPTVSRLMEKYSSIGRNDKPGLRLIQTQQTLTDMRFKTVSLTAKGRRIHEQLQEVLQ